jgi:hypothetical protein
MDRLLDKPVRLCTIVERHCGWNAARSVRENVSVQVLPIEERRITCARPRSSRANAFAMSGRVFDCHTEEFVDECCLIVENLLTINSAGRPTVFS